MTNQYNMLLHVRNSILFVGLCILAIALIGLIAYIRDEVNRRRSEIAIRIIHGAQVKDVQLIFLKDITHTLENPDYLFVPGHTASTRVKTVLDIVMRCGLVLNIKLLLK